MARSDNRAHVTRVKLGVGKRKEGEWAKPNIWLSVVRGPREPRVFLPSFLPSFSSFGFPLFFASPRSFVSLESRGFAFDTTRYTHRVRRGQRRRAFVVVPGRGGARGYGGSSLLQRRRRRRSNGGGVGRRRVLHLLLLGDPRAPLGRGRGDDMERAASRGAARQPAAAGPSLRGEGAVSHLVFPSSSLFFVAFDQGRRQNSRIGRRAEAIEQSGHSKLHQCALPLLLFRVPSLAAPLRPMRAPRLGRHVAGTKEEREGERRERERDKSEKRRH